MNAFIKSLMDEYGITQKELAGILGISTSAVSQWKECSTMSVETLFALSQLFQVTVDELVLEKYADETPEQKWDRLYNLDGYEWDELLEDKEKMLVFIEKLNNINSRFYKLLYKKMKGSISALEINELSTLERYFICEYMRSIYFQNKHFDCFDNNRDARIAEILDESIGLKNESAIIWELQRIYRNSKMISFEQVREAQNDTLIYAWFSALTQENKDYILTKKYKQGADNDDIYEFIKRGGRILYALSDLSYINFNKSDLEEFEGEKKPLKNLDEVKKVFWSMDGCYSHLSYEQYQIIINKSAMRKVEAEHKYKKRDPIKYWEFIKQWRI